MRHQLADGQEGKGPTGLECRVHTGRPWRATSPPVKGGRPMPFVGQDVRAQESEDRGSGQDRSGPGRWSIPFLE